jgi:hypothetical protein
MPVDAYTHVARWPMTYNGQELDRGQAFRVIGARNDEKLVRLGYIAELAPVAELYECGVCGARFIGLGERQGHGDKRHSPVPRTPEEEEARQEREERLLLETSPLGAGAR